MSLRDRRVMGQPNRQCDVRYGEVLVLFLLETPHVYQVARLQPIEGVIVLPV